MEEFKSLELKEQVRLFNKFCEQPYVTDEEVKIRWKSILEEKIYNTLVKANTIQGIDIENSIEESIDELNAWIDEQESWEKFLKEHFKKNP